MDQKIKSKKRLAISNVSHFLSLQNCWKLMDCNEDRQKDTNKQHKILFTKPDNLMYATIFSYLDNNNPLCYGTLRTKMVKSNLSITHSGAKPPSARIWLILWVVKSA